MRVVDDGCGDGAGVGTEDGSVFCLDFGEGGRVLGEVVIGVANGGAGGIVAGEQHGFDVADGGFFEFGVELRLLFVIVSTVFSSTSSLDLLEVCLQSQVDDMFGSTSTLPACEAFIEPRSDVPVHLPIVVPLNDGPPNIPQFARLELRTACLPPHL